MSFQTIKRTLAMAIIGVMLLSIGVQALAEQAYVKESVSVYSQPKKSSGKLGSLKSGSEIELVAKKSGWAMIQKGGVTGYVKASAVVALERVDEVTAYTKSATVMYAAGSKKLGTIPKGEAVVVTARAGSMACVRYGQNTGYVKASKLTASAPAAESSDAVAKRTVYAARDGAKVYNASGKAVGSVSVNSEMTLTGVKGSLCRVVRDGKTGYMYKSDLSESPVSVEAETPSTDASAGDAAQTVHQTAYVSKEGAKLYNANGKSVGKLSLNAQVTVVAVNGNVCKVESGSTTAYMKKSELSESPVEKTETLCETAYANKEGAKLYDIKGKVIGSLSLNDQVTVTAVKSKVCQVSVGGKTAYMYKADLSCDKTAQADDGVTEIAKTKAYVNKDGAAVVDADGKQLTTLSVNTEVTVTAFTDTTAQVVNDSVTGYMKRADLSASKVEAGETTLTLKYGDSGEAVKRVQNRLKELGYFSGTVGGNYQSLTQSAVAAFQSAAKLSVTGAVDVKTLETLFSDSAPKNIAATNAGGTSSTSSATPAHGKAIEMDWWTSDIQKIFARGTTATITDVATGLAWREQRRGGTNHADCQPLTAADTAVLKYVYGGTWSWARRAIFVTINGVNYAASMNGMPHGSGSITDNNFNGHHCIHFTNSRTHGSNKVCSLHQAAIKKALAATL